MEPSYGHDSIYMYHEMLQLYSCFACEFNSLIRRTGYI